MAKINRCTVCRTKIHKDDELCGECKERARTKKFGKKESSFSYPESIFRPPVWEPPVWKPPVWEPPIWDPRRPLPLPGTTWIQ